MSIYKSREFLKLKTTWYERLKAAGFDDLEDEKEKLRSYNGRKFSTEETRDAVLTYFLRFDEFLSGDPAIPDHHLAILTLFTKGRQIGDIVEIMNLSNTTVRNVIRKYRKEIFG